MFKKKNKKQNEFLSQLDNNPMLKQIVFFGFYLVFFVVLIILLRTGYKNNTSKEVKSSRSGYLYDYKLDRILNQNYHFVFKENLNGNEVIYEGDLFDNELSFVKSGVVSSTYYINDDKVYLKDNNLLTWNEVNNPMVFYQFTNGKLINKLIKKAKYISKTEYIHSEKKEYLYNITSDEIRSILDIEKLNDDTVNTIVVSILENGNVNSISLDLTNYYKYSDNNIISYKLVFSFSKYDEIEEIANPIN